MTNEIKLKKYKGQIPYKLFVWLTKEAKYQGATPAVFLRCLVFYSGHKDYLIRVDDKTRRWAEKVRDSSPNNIHFIANEEIAECFEAFIAPARKTWSHNRRLDNLKKERRRGLFVFKHSAARKTF